MKTIIKKIASLIPVFVFIVIIFSSCNRNVCPTFSHSELEMIDIHAQKTDAK